MTPNPSLPRALASCACPVRPVRLRPGESSTEARSNSCWRISPVAPDLGSWLSRSLGLALHQPQGSTSAPVSARGRERTVSRPRWASPSMRCSVFTSCTLGCCSAQRRRVCCHMSSRLPAPVRRHVMPVDPLDLVGMGVGPRELLQAVLEVAHEARDRRGELVGARTRT